MAESDSGIVKICNMALARIGVDEFISSFDDKSDEGKICGIFYEDVRDICLAAFRWPFATRRAVLAQSTTVRDGWAYAYVLPDNCVEPHYVYPTGLAAPSLQPLYDNGQAPPIISNPRTPRADQRTPFAIEADDAKNGDTRILLCDLSDVTLVYTSRVEDTTKYPATFRNALSWRLGAEICMPLEIKPDREEKCWKRYQETIMEAMARAFAGEQEDVPPDSEMIVGRR